MSSTWRNTETWSKAGKPKPHSTGSPFYWLDDQLVLIATSDGTSPPQLRYIAAVATYDERLDLAVLQVVGDESGPLDPATLNLPYLPLGNSDAVQLGDPIDIFSYPGISGGVLTYTQGVVSAFSGQEGVSARAWIITDATMSGGTSGGTAVNRQGELIGVPTQGSNIDCRPGDVNQDGRIDASDVGCIPTGGSLGELRPINFAVDLLARAGQAHLPTPGGTGQEPSVIQEPAEMPPAVPPRAAGPMPAVATLLPAALPLEHAACFRVEDEGTLTFDELTARLGGARMRQRDSAIGGGKQAPSAPSPVTILPTAKPAGLT